MEADPVRGVTHQRLIADALAELDTIGEHGTDHHRAWAHWARSECLRVAGRPRASLAAFDAWLAAIGEGGEQAAFGAYAQAADALPARGDYARSWALSEWLLSAGVDAWPERKRTLAQIAFSMVDELTGRHGCLAADICSAAEATFPHLLYDVRATQVAGKAYAADGQMERAEALLGRAAAALPQDPRALWQHFTTQTQSGRPIAEIEQTYETLVARCGAGSSLTANATYMMALMYAQRREPQKALEYLDSYESMSGPSEASSRLRKRLAGKP